MTITLTLDNIIYSLQKNGGASLYWKELVSRVQFDTRFNVKFVKGSRYTRLFPAISNSDIFHSSHFRTSFPRKSKIVSTIHDLTYEKGIVSSSMPGKIINICQRTNAIERADAIICISENTKKEMLDIYPCADKKPIYVIWHGCSFTRDKIVDIHTVSRLVNWSKVLKNFALYVGTRHSYKNFSVALLGFATSSLPSNGFSLVCTGANFSESEMTIIQKLDITGKVFVLNYATHEELSYLYQNAFALIYPSTYEGFGLPPLEAMSSGTPVIAANRSSIPEVVNDAGILIDEIENPETIKNALETLLNDQIRSTYVSKGLERAKLFSWENSANQHMEIYQSLFETH
jgi:glycosyltransferase involved in cell wall biosynthesis